MALSKVNWREWSEATFADAKAQDKPVLLGISAVWCHWCHVMDRGVPGDPTHTGTYSTDDIAGYINQNFVPVRVDNDQRPDINARYNMGGWPSTCFLTPDGDVIYGGTYFAPSQMRGLLQQVLQYWTNRRDELEEQLKQAPSDERRMTSEDPKSETLATRRSALDIPSAITETLIKNYDKRNGGLGGGQKFPMSDAWELLLAVYAQTGEEKLLEMVSQTLISMGTKGMYDAVAGGFFRYSTTPDWSVPHFEKMLEDHGRLLPVYLHTIQTTRGKAHTQPLAAVLEQVTRTAFEYLITTLLHDKLGLTYFAGSQDADEEYYLLSKSERAERPAPFIDWRLYADWNAVMVSALFLAADVLREPRYAALAEKILTTLVRLCLNEDGSVTHSVTIDEAASLQHMLRPAPLRGQLGDQAALARACIEQHLRGETESRLYGRSRLEIAQKLSAYAMQKLAAPEGGFYDSPENPQALGMLKVRLKPIFDNAAMSEVLLMLAKTEIQSPESKSFDEIARRALDAFVEEAARYREHGSPYALAVMRATSEPTEVMIVAEAKDSAPFVQAANQTYALWRMVRVLHPKHDAALIAQRGYPTHNLPVAFVCKGTTCSAPIFNASEL